MSARILLLFCAIIGVRSLSVPNFTPCRSNDTVCLKRTAEQLYHVTIAGIPELGMEKLDPIYQEKIDGDLGVIKYKLHNSTLIGLNSCHMGYAKLSSENSTLRFDMTCPNLSMYGLYEISGQLMIIPIEGNGNYRIDCKDYYIRVDTDIKISPGKDGKTHMLFKGFKIGGDLRGGMVTDLTNLFNGQKEELAATTLRFVNENWKPVASLLQGPVFNAYVRRLIKNCNKYLKTIPYEQMVQQEF